MASNHVNDCCCLGNALSANYRLPARPDEAVDVVRQEIHPRSDGFGRGCEYNEGAPNPFTGGRRSIRGAVEEPLVPREPDEPMECTASHASLHREHLGKT